MPAGWRGPAPPALPAVTIESKPFGKDRAAFEAALQAALDQHRVELICLGGFMRLFTAEFVQRWHGRMLNIHPSLLPSFPGLDPHGQALRAGVKISGATVHFVIPETDAGPIVMQGAVAVADDDTAETLAARILRSGAPHLSRSAAAARRRRSAPRRRCLQDVGNASAGGVLISPALSGTGRDRGLQGSRLKDFASKASRDDKDCEMDELKNKIPRREPGAIMIACADRDEVYETFRFSAELLPRFSTRSYSTT